MIVIVIKSGWIEIVVMVIVIERGWLVLGGDSQVEQREKVKHSPADVLQDVGCQVSMTTERQGTGLKWAPNCGSILHREIHDVPGRGSCYQQSRYTQ